MLNTGHASGIRAPGFLRRVNELTSASDVIWLLALISGLTCTLAAAFIFPFTSAGKFLVYATILIMGLDCFAISRRYARIYGQMTECVLIKNVTYLNSRILILA